MTGSGTNVYFVDLKRAGASGTNTYLPVYYSIYIRMCLHLLSVRWYVR